MSEDKPPLDRAVRSPKILFGLNIALAAASLVAIATLILEYGGFRPVPVPRGLLHAVQLVVVLFFVLDRLVRLRLARDPGAYLRQNWVDFGLIGVGLAVLAIGYRFHLEIISAGTLYVIITQGYLFVVLVLRGIGVNLLVAQSRIHPSILFAGSFAVLCLVGSGLLMLPAATTSSRGIWYLDALFTSTSATCVTGLIVLDTGGDFTPFGQAVILLLIQAGGLGVMLFGSVLAMMIGKGLTVRSSTALGEMLGTKRVGELGRTVRFVVLVTLVTEAAGACLLYPMFRGAQQAGLQRYRVAGAVWDSVFHSVSAFCNAGFSLHRANMMAGVNEGWAVPLREHWQMLGVMAPLIVLGGLGFPVLRDCAGFGWAHLCRFRRLRSGSAAERLTGSARPRLTLQSKLVLWASGLLIVWGAVVLLLLEPPLGRRDRVGSHRIERERVRVEADWQEMKSIPRVREALFHSITARTAGFNTIDMAELSDAGKLWLCGLMVIGGSPAGTAGGMKTMTFALLVLTAYCVLRRREEVEVFGRSVSPLLLRKAVTLLVLYAGLVAAVTLLLCVAMRGNDLVDLLFEACSACGTVGLSAGVTAKLTTPAKFVIIGGMFIGRLGPLTLLVALFGRVRPARYSYPAEEVLIG